MKLFGVIRGKILDLYLLIQKNKIETAATALFIAVLVFAYRKWIFNLKPLSFTDWGYLMHDSLVTGRLTYVNLWSNDHGLGRILIDVSQGPIYAIPGLLAAWFNVGFEVSERLFYFWPVILLTPIGAYLLLRFIYPKNKLAHLIGVIVFTFNIPFLMAQTSQLTIMMAFSLVPFCILSLLKLLERPNMMRVLIFTLVMGLQSIYEFRIAYVTIAISLFIVLFHVLFIAKNNRERASQLGLASVGFFLLGLLNAFWILGLSKVGVVTNNELFNRGLFGNNFMNLDQALTLFHPYWTGSAPKVFTVQPIPAYLWLIPALVIIGLYINRKNKLVILFGIISMLGILLVKQVDQPFSGLYPWLYSHIPGFNAFREASKFYFLIALGYSVLIAGLANLRLDPRSIKTRKGRYFVRASTLLLVAVIFLPNAYQIGTTVTATFSPRTIPADYKILERYLSNDKNFGRTLWVPTLSRWSYYSNKHPSASAISLNSADYKSLYSDSEQQLDKFSAISELLEKEITGTAHELSNIKYIIVPVRDTLNEDDFYPSYGDDPQYFINLLSQLKNYERIQIGTSSLAIFRAKDEFKYFDSPSSIQTLKQVSGVETLAKFNAEVLGKQLLFMTNSNNQKSISAQYSQMTLGEPSNSVHFEQGRLYEPISSYFGGNIYFNIAPVNHEYSLSKDGVFTLSSKAAYSQSLIDGKPTSIPATKKTITRQKLDAAKTKYLAYEGKIEKLQNDGQVHYLGEILNEIRLIGSNGSPNLASSFTPKVISCEESSSVIVNKTDSLLKSSGSTLDIEAKKHNTCVEAANISVSSGQKYILNVDAVNTRSDEASYKVLFNDSKETINYGRLPTSGTAPKRSIGLIQVPDGATNAQLVLIAPTHGSAQGTSSYTKYSDLSLNLAQDLLASPITSKPIYAKEAVQPGSTSLMLEGTGISFKNLITNGSFEDGLWKKKVDDCNDYDNNPRINMQLSNIASRGKNSLELSAARHFACTSQTNIPVNERRTYLLSFKHQSSTNSSGSFNIGYNDPESSNRSHTFASNPKWSYYSTIIRVPSFADKATISLYSKPSEGSNMSVNNYDDVSLYEVPDTKRQIFYIENEQNIRPPNQIVAGAHTPTTRSVSIKGATTAFYLTMSEAYHPGWRLSLKNNKIQGLFNGSTPWAKPDSVSDSNHFKLNEFSNGWLVNVAELCSKKGSCKENNDGSKDIELIADFAPQRWLNIGYIISGATLISCVSGLVYFLIKRRRGKVRAKTSHIKSGFDRI